MALLMVNYALFGDPTLTMIGWIIAAIEASTAVLRLIKTIFRNNKKIVEKCDRAIAKHEKALTLLREKQAEYKKILAVESVDENIKDTSLSDTADDDQGGAEISPSDPVGISQDQNDDIKFYNENAKEIEKEIAEDLARAERADDYISDANVPTVAIPTDDDQGDDKSSPESAVGDVVLSSESAALFEKFCKSLKNE